MVESNPRFLPGCLGHLSEQGVEIHQLSGVVLCSRIHDIALVFPWSKSYPGLMIYFSKGVVHQQIFLLGYPEQLEFQECEYERLLLKAAKLNAEETLATWKIERKNGKICLLLDMSLYLRFAENVNRDLVSRGCEEIHRLFEAKAYRFRDIKEVIRTDIRVGLGFLRVEERSTHRGIRFRIVLNDYAEVFIGIDLCIDIEVTDLIIYEIHSTTLTEIVDSPGFSQNSFNALMVTLNQDLPIGRFSYNSISDKAQLVSELDYKNISPPALRQSLITCHETMVKTYQRTVSKFIRSYLETEFAFSAGLLVKLHYNRYHAHSYSLSFPHDLSICAKLKDIAESLNLLQFQFDWKIKHRNGRIVPMLGMPTELSLSSGQIRTIFTIKAVQFWKASKHLDGDTNGLYDATLGGPGVSEA